MNGQYPPTSSVEANIKQVQLPSYARTVRWVYEKKWTKRSRDSDMTATMYQNNNSFHKHLHQNHCLIETQTSNFNEVIRKHHSAYNV